MSKIGVGIIGAGDISPSFPSLDGGETRNRIEMTTTCTRPVPLVPDAARALLN